MVTDRKRISELAKNLRFAVAKPGSLTADFGWNPRVIEELGYSGDPMVASWFAQAVWDWDLEVQEVAAQAIERLLESLAPELIPTLDQRVRFREYGRWGCRKRVVFPEQMRGSPRLRTWKLRMAAMSGCGHMREAAVRRMDGDRAEFALGLLTTRLADWVPQVAAAAARGLERSLPVAQPQDLLGCVGLLHRARRWTRTSHSNVLDSWEKRLCVPAAVPDLLAATGSPSQSVRRAVLPLLWRAAPVDQHADLIRQLLATGADPWLRSKALQAARTLDDAILLPIVEAALSDRHGFLRRDGLRILVERWPEQRDRAKSLLFDRSSGVRLLARHALKPMATSDFRSIGLEKLETASSGCLPGVLAGLAEFGDPEDRERIRSFLAHDSPQCGGRPRPHSWLWVETARLSRPGQRSRAPNRR